MLPIRLCLLPSVLTLFLVSSPAQALEPVACSSPLLQDDAPPEKKTAKRERKRPSTRKKKSDRPTRSSLPNPYLDAKPLSAAQAMARFDANRDKRLDPRELKAARADAAERKRLMNVLLRKFDRDKNGAINKQEMALILGEQAAIQRKATEAAYDLDGNKRLDRHERQAMLRDLDSKREARADGELEPEGKGKRKGKNKNKTPVVDQESALREQLIKRFDEDGDGKLSPKEFRETNIFIQEQRMAEAREAEPKPKVEPEGKDETKPRAKPEGQPKKAKQEPRPSKAERRALLLEEFDLDKDGKLSEEERKASRQKQAPRPEKAKPKQGPEPKPKLTGAEWQQRILDRFDTDKDGTLSKEERVIYLADKAKRAKKKAPKKGASKKGDEGN